MKRARLKCLHYEAKGPAKQRCGKAWLSPMRWGTSWSEESTHGGPVLQIKHWRHQREKSTLTEVLARSPIILLAIS